MRENEIENNKMFVLRKEGRKEGLDQSNLRGCPATEGDDTVTDRNRSTQENETAPKGLCGKPSLRFLLRKDGNRRYEVEAKAKNRITMRLKANP